MVPVFPCASATAGSDVGVQQLKRLEMRFDRFFFFLIYSWSLLVFKTHQRMANDRNHSVYGDATKHLLSVPCVLLTVLCAFMHHCL